LIVSWIYQSKDDKIDICYFSAIKHTVLSSKSKDGMDKSLYNISEWSDFCTVFFFKKEIEISVLASTKQISSSSHKKNLFLL